MKNILFLLSTTVVLILTNISISAQKVNFGKERFPKLIEKLNLNDEQRDKIKDLQFKEEESRIELQSDLQKNRLEIKKLMASDEFNEEALLTLVENGGNIRNEIMKSSVAFWLDVNKILGSDQKEIWKKHFNIALIGNERFFERGRRDISDRKQRFNRLHKRQDRF